MTSGRRALLRAAPVLLTVALAGCGSPPTNYYQMAVVQGAADPVGPLAVGVRRISIPSILDQNGIVKPSGLYQFDSYSDELWAEPLADMLQGLMVQELGQRLPNATVINSAGAIGAPRDVLIEIDVLRFDPDAAGQITLSAQIAVRAGNNQALWLTRSFQGSVAAGAGVAGMVATMSTLWAAAADQTATMIAAAWTSHATH